MRRLGVWAGLVVAWVSSGSASGDMPIGVARIDVTPEAPIRLSGYAARGEVSKGVQQRIWAKALAFGGDDAGPAVLIAVDNLGIPDTMTAEVARRLAARSRVTRERLAIGASHTHSAPCLVGVAPNLFGQKLPDDQQAAIERYTQTLTDALERVAVDALTNRKPGRLAYAKGSVGFAANRRTPGGPVDHDVPTLVVQDPEGRPRAVLVNYACHCTTLPPADNLVAGDWAGEAQEAIERDHPGVIALTLIGCGADSNPNPRRQANDARDHGQALAAEVKRLLGGTLRPIASDAPPRAQLKRVRLDLDTLPTRAELEALVKAGSYPGYNAKTHLDRLNRGESIQDHLDYPVQTWAFGDDLLMVFLAGEVVVDYSLRLKQEFDPDRLWVTAYANDAPCYIPSERILREGGYEGGGAMVYYGLPTRLAAGLEDKIIATVKAIAPTSYQRKGTSR